MDNSQAYDQNPLLGLRVVALNATPTGTGAQDAVLRFNGLGTSEGQVAASTWVTQVNDATNGTTFAFLKRGKYSVDLFLDCQTAVTVVAGITYNSAALGADPSFATDPALRARGRYVQAAAGDAAPLNLHAEIDVSQADVNAGTAVLRAHATNGAGASVTAASLNLGECALIIRRISDSPGN